MPNNITNVTPPTEYNKEKGYKSVGEILKDMLLVSNSALACAYRKHIADKANAGKEVIKNGVKRK